jgi:hypothetical protein
MLYDFFAESFHNKTYLASLGTLCPLRFKIYVMFIVRICSQIKDVYLSVLY